MKSSLLLVNLLFIITEDGFGTNDCFWKYSLKNISKHLSKKAIISFHYIVIVYFSFLQIPDVKYL